MIFIEEQDKILPIVKTFKTFEWKKFTNLCVSIGKELNERQWRFMKAIFLENALSLYSNGKLIYVGDKNNGCDFMYENIKIEMKYCEECLFHRKNKTLKNKTKEITLMNSKGTNKHTQLPHEYSDYLLIVEIHGAALISKEVLSQYILIKGDSISAKIPTDKLHIVFSPSDMNEDIDENKTKDNNLCIKESILKTVLEIINKNT